MKAVVCTRYGAPEVLELTEVEKPCPKFDEVQIRIHATTVTASDVLIRSLAVAPLYKFFVQVAFGFGKPRSPILGMVVAGVVECTGISVSAFKPGDEVFAYCSMSATKNRFGSYAKYICLPENWNLALKPAGLSFEEAAAIPYGGLMAEHLMNMATIKNGDHVLIYGASGSIGTMLLQLAKIAGAVVTSVCSGNNRELVKNLGSDETIDYTCQDAEKQLESYDIVIDAVGKSKTSDLKQRVKKALKKGGKYISIDDGTPVTPQSSFIRLKELATQGKLKPVIDRVYPLEEIVEAHRYVEKGHKKGNVVIRVVS